MRLPSSPDGTRVAYKKRFKVDGRIFWELHVLDLATDRETRLSERRSIDDQLEWLDEANVLYSVPETDDDTSVSTNVWVTQADGKGDPRLFLRRAYSPAAVDTFPDPEVTRPGPLTEGTGPFSFA